MNSTNLQPDAQTQTLLWQSFTNGVSFACQARDVDNVRPTSNELELEFQRWVSTGYVQNTIRRDRRWRLLHAWRKFSNRVERAISG